MLANLPYYLSIAVFICGLFVTLSSNNFFEKIIGLGVLQVGVLVFYIALGKIYGGIAPVRVADIGVIYSNPLPHVLMLTAIVVGLATLSVGLSLLLKIQRNFGTINEDELTSRD